jgi:hypothetical protein
MVSAIEIWQCGGKERCQANGCGSVMHLYLSPPCVKLSANFIAKTLNLAN